MQVTNTFFDGSGEVPYVGLEPIAVTKDNMDLIINDGYHLEEEIYLNINKQHFQTGQNCDFVKTHQKNATCF